MSEYWQQELIDPTQSDIRQKVPEIYKDFSGKMDLESWDRIIALNMFILWKFTLFNCRKFEFDEQSFLYDENLAFQQEVQSLVSSRNCKNVK